MHIIKDPELATLTIDKMCKHNNACCCVLIHCNVLAKGPVGVMAGSAAPIPSELCAIAVPAANRMIAAAAMTTRRDEDMVQLSLLQISSKRVAKI